MQKALPLIFKITLVLWLFGLLLSLIASVERANSTTAIFVANFRTVSDTAGVFAIGIGIYFVIQRLRAPLVGRSRHRL